jgi:hypothetical protein
MLTSPSNSRWHGGGHLEFEDEITKKVRRIGLCEDIGKLVFRGN